MQSKHAAACAGFEKNQAYLRCPVCGRSMQAAQGSLRCAAGHCYDIAKKGYVNFHGAAGDGHHYDKELFRSRRIVFSEGLYAPVADALQDTVRKYAGEKGPPCILDAGCGEGYYINALARKFPGVRFGVDLSRQAIELATDYAGVLFCVADLAKLPFGEGCFDIVLNILSPANYSEFVRVLRPGGVIIKVVPESGYLRQLRDAITPGSSYSGEDVKSHMQKSAQIIEEKRICYTCEVPPGLAGDVLHMTPLSAGKEKEGAKALHEITIDMAIYVLTPR